MLIFWCMGLNSKASTIQLMVDKMSGKAESRGESATLSSSGSGGRRAIVPSMRPSTSRKTEGVSRPCKVCGSNSWDTDEVRGETSCSECGYVAEENMMDLGAEWTNHSGGDDRSRVGAPTTVSYTHLTLPTKA